MLATIFSPLSKEIKRCIIGTFYLATPQQATASHFLPVSRPRVWGTSLDRDSYTSASCSFSYSSCAQCSEMIKGNVVRHPHAGKRFSVSHKITCQTKNMSCIYWCVFVACFTWGKTVRKLKIRVLDHEGNICNKDERVPSARHLITPDICSLKFEGAEVVSVTSIFFFTIIKTFVYFWIVGYSLYL